MDMRDTINLLERRIGTAVRLDEIPPAYKGLPVIGRGATSVVLEKDPKTVLMLTRDHMKVEWLLSTGHAQIIDEFDSHKNHMRGAHEIPVVVIQMPKFEKLDPANRKLIKEAIEEFRTVNAAMRNKQTRSGRYNKDEHIRDVLMHFSENENHILADLWSHLMNYDAKQYEFDLDARQFLQDANRTIIIVDPIVATDILSMMQAHAANRYAQKYPDQRW